MLKRKHFFTVALCVLLIAATVLFAASPSFAYFRALFDKVGENTVMVELIFDRLNFDGPNAEALAQLGFTDEQDGVEVPWGSRQNPYVISAKHHIQNLSVLQNSGFFAGRVEKDENGEPVLVDGKTVPVQSYFLVCTPDGTPVTVDCE